MNIAYSQEYKEQREKYLSLITPESRCTYFDGSHELEGGYSVHYKVYHGEMKTWNAFPSENALLDKDGNPAFVWHNIDHNGNVSHIFRHANGKQYLLFHIDLYGYSILELESGKEFHYVPSESFSKDGNGFDETFLWVVPHYDPESNLIAVEGCYWAYPYSVIVTDFSDPFAEQPTERWIDIHALIDPNFERYDDIDFVRWESGALCVNCHRSSDDRNDQCEEIRFTVEELREKMRTKK